MASATDRRCAISRLPVDFAPATRLPLANCAAYRIIRVVSRWEKPRHCGAEGATAPETLRQKDQREVLNSGDKAKVKAEAGRRDNNLRRTGQRGLIRFGVLRNANP